MRKDFAKILHSEMSKNEKLILLTADLGYGLWDSIRIDYPDRFYNCMSSEQLMLGCAIGMSMNGFIPVCYSITPFLLFRPFELIRNYLNHESMNVKLVGGGRDRDYGYLGFSHWAEDDLEFMNLFSNIQSYKPDAINHDYISKLLSSYNPVYINLRK